MRRDLNKKAIDVFEGMVEIEMAATKCKKAEAIRHVVAHHPDAHRAYVEAVNRERDMEHRGRESF
jgi:hypothetical protein